MKISFLGLGTMGWPMAANLLAAGYDLRAWNRSPEPGQRLAASGAQVASSPREAVRDADVVILILADDAATRSTLQAADEALRPGAIVVNMATVSAELSAVLAADFAGRGIRYVAAPVLGRVDVAEAGELNILAAGEAAAIDTVQPLFDVMGRKTWRYGERPEQASVVKLAVNFMIASAIGAMGEAAALVRGHGVDAADFLGLVTSTGFASPVYQGYGSAIADERFTPAGFRLALGLKDVNLAIAAAEQARVPLTLASTVRDAIIEGLAHGDGDLDFAALARTSARRAGQA